MATSSTSVYERTDAPQPIDFGALERQKLALHRQGRLHWIHWTIVSLSVLVTFFAWNTSRTMQNQRMQQNFERESEHIVDLMLERLSHYEDALLSSIAAIQKTAEPLDRASWREYAARLDITGRYPGIGGIGVIKHVASGDIAAFVAAMRKEKADFDIHTSHEFPFHLPIVYIEPENTNAAAVGLDVAFETNRREAALKARSLGTTQMSGPIVLVQDVGRTPGFLLYAPFYSRSSSIGPESSTREREAAFEGLVYAPLVVKALVDGVLALEGRQVSMSIHDGSTTLYSEHDPREIDSASDAPSRVEAVDFHGRTWVFDIRGTPAMQASSGVIEPVIVLIAGLAIDTLLLALFIMMNRSNRRTLLLAELITSELSSKAVALNETNQDLESFAHVVSHDLKAPMRGIQDLTDFLEEDLADYMTTPDANVDVRRSLDLLRRQAVKGTTLISGILEYSLVGAEDESQSIVDANALVEDVGRALRLGEGQLIIDGTLPVFRTRAVRFGQILTNLIGNAFKYNDDLSSAVTQISASEVDGFYRFSIADNGPGIEACYHERIFKAFTTLAVRDDVHSSGIGLSIVKRSVETLGGHVEVESVVGSGTTFHFTWPMDVCGQEEGRAAA